MPPALKRIARIFNNPFLSAISNVYFLVTFPGTLLMDVAGWTGSLLMIFI